MNVTYCEMQLLSRKDGYRGCGGGTGGRRQEVQWCDSERDKGIKKTMLATTTTTTSTPTTIKWRDC